MNLDIFEFTNQGGRERNEDCLGSRKFEDGVLCVVADGLGGHRDGEIASKSVVDTFLHAPLPTNPAQGKEWLASQTEEANQTLIAMQKERSSNMKSTSAVLLIQNQKAAWANVGDTRVYFLHGDEIASVTEDHSVAYRKYRAGEITRRQIAFDPDQSSLLRVLGNEERHAPALFSPPVPLEEGDGFLLCSDGMWECVSDEEILIEYLKSCHATDWGEGLLLRAIARVQPNHDNLSMIAVRVCERGKRV